MLETRVKLFKKFIVNIKRKSLLTRDNLQNMALMVLKIKDSTIVASSAGMPPIYICRGLTGNVEEHIIKGMPLGAVNYYPYDIVNLDLMPHDTVLLLSDGFPELLNENKETLDYSKVKSILKSVCHKSPQEIIEHLHSVSDQWKGNSIQNDDMTFIVFKIKST